MITIFKFTLTVIASILATFIFRAFGHRYIFSSDHLVIDFLGNNKYLSGNLSGIWQFNWKIKSSQSMTGKYKNTNSYSVRISQVWKFVAFHYVDNHEKYLFNAIIESPNKITGRWYSDRKHGYYGIFQGHVDYALNTIEGKWLGFNSKNEIVSNLFELKRKPI